MTQGEGTVMEFKQLKAQTERQSNFELLRIISMFLIVLSHYLGHGAKFEVGEETAQNFFKVLFGGGGVGVVCFILISAYFLVDVENFRPRRIFLVWFCVFVYSLSIGIVQYFKIPDFGINNVIRAAMPVTNSYWWFANIYLIVCFFIPYINKFINCLEKKQFEILLIIIFILWGMLPFVTDESFGENEFVLFIALFLFVAYLKRYPIKEEKGMGFILFGVGFVLTVVSILYLQSHGRQNSDYWYRADSITMWTELPQMIQGIGLFLVFKNISMKNSVVINAVAAATFQVYLLSDHWFVREWLWGKVFNNAKYHDSHYFFLHAIVSSFIVFVAASLVGCAYRLLIEAPIVALFDKAVKKVKSASDT